MFFNTQYLEYRGAIKLTKSCFVLQLFLANKFVTFHKSVKNCIIVIRYYFLLHIFQIKIIDFLNANYHIALVSL